MFIAEIEDVEEAALVSLLLIANAIYTFKFYYRTLWCLEWDGQCWEHCLICFNVDEENQTRIEHLKQKTKKENAWGARTCLVGRIDSGFVSTSFCWMPLDECWLSTLVYEFLDFVLIVFPHKGQERPYNNSCIL